MSHRVALALLAGYALVLTVAATGGPLERGQRVRVVGYGQIRYQGAGPERWAARYRQARRELAELRGRLHAEQRVLLHRPNVVEAINLASATYGHAAELWRKARCETGGTFDPRSLNGSSSAAGLFQFLPSTWRSTPYAVFSVWSPYANAMAAGWMHAHGRGGEWDCS